MKIDMMTCPACGGDGERETDCGRKVIPCPRCNGTTFIPIRDATSAELGSLVVRLREQIARARIALQGGDA